MLACSARLKSALTTEQLDTVLFFGRQLPFLEVEVRLTGTACRLLSLLSTLVFNICPCHHHLPLAALVTIVSCCHYCPPLSSLSTFVIS